MIESIGTENGAGSFRPSRANEARETEDLAVVRFERNADELNGVRIARIASTGQALDLERDVPMLGNRALAIERADVAPHHHADDRLDIGLGDLARGDVMAVSQHSIAIAEAENLVEPMRDKNDR